MVSIIKNIPLTKIEDIQSLVIYNRITNANSQDRAIGLAIQLFDTRYDTNLETLMAETNPITINTAVYRFDFPSINTYTLGFSISHSISQIIDESSSEKEVVTITTITNNPDVINTDATITGSLSCNTLSTTGNINVGDIITAPNQVSFKAGRIASDTINTSIVLPFDNVIYNIGGGILHYPYAHWGGHLLG